MCGICGYINLRKGTMPSREVLEAMCRVLAHRGPDDQGTYFEDFVALGHRRLSIIDLTGGHQPLFNETGTIAIVFNGEIYNFPEIKAELEKTGRHIFKTHSDTEVIVHLYEEEGEKCVERFNGMFAFALWDREREILFCARDRMGKKPLYYTVQGGYAVFASELKSLLKFSYISAELSIDSLSKYLAFECVPAPLTIYDKIRKLEPGHFFIIDVKSPPNSTSDVKTRQYWDMRFNEQPGSVAEYERGFLERFHKAVERRLISDVPLGVFLSGGIDSSSVVAMMAEMMPAKDIKTFSIGFEEKSFDESSYARLVAGCFGTDHKEEMLKPQTLLEILPTVCETLDEPFADPSIIPTYLLSRFTRQHVTVALGGDGGDELFAGYDPFLAHYPAKYLEIVPLPILRGLYQLAHLLPVSTRNVSFDFKVKQFLSAMHYRYGKRHFAWLGSFTPEAQRELFAPEAYARLNSANPYSVIDDYLSKIEIKDELEGIIYLYAKIYLQDTILVKVDRASMANSLEVRAPFLDVNVVDYLGTVPNRLKLHRLTTKYLLKKAMDGRLPRDVIYRRKKGFGIPIAKWFKEELKPLLIELFDETKLKREGLFNPAFVRRMMEDHFAGRRDNRKQLWTLFMFEQWYRRYYRKASS
jgi:asparagine synthase (glutamine-hydrolysing)